MTVKQRQHLLAYLGYYVGAVDGDWGSGSRAACTAFQKDFGGITVDGHGWHETDKALRHAVAYDMFKADNVVEETLTGSFWDEIEYFSRDEFRCKCGGKYCDGFPAEPKEQLVRIADQLRKNLGVPITIVSGLRCPSWNQIQGGGDNSQHMYGEAADIYADGMSQLRVETELDNIGGVRYHYPISGSSNVHFDIPKGAR
jgi:peptidoglycan hydrolase-like protein with peptidoglycan-binding domain